MVNETQKVDERELPYSSLDNLFARAIGNAVELGSNITAAQLRTARKAVAELIAADIEFNAAMFDMDISRAFAARERRITAMSLVGGRP